MAFIIIGLIILSALLQHCHRLSIKLAEEKSVNAALVAGDNADRELLAETAVVCTMRYDQAREAGAYDDTPTAERHAMLEHEIETEFNVGRATNDCFHFSQ